MKNPQRRLVFLDAGTVDYGDLPLDLFKKYGAFKVFHATSAEQMPGRLKRAQIAITNKCRFPRELLNRLKNLHGIFVTATGTNNIDLKAAKENGIAVANVPGYSTQSVVQFTIGFILSLAGNLLRYNQVAHDGTWSRSQFFAYGAFPIKEVYGKKLGIIGYGAIGKTVAKIAQALGMQVMVSRIPGRRYSRKEAAGRYSFEQVIRQSDFVTIHAPLSSLTQNLINMRVLGKMKPGAFLINMARGGIVNEKALLKALRSGHLAGAATDVLTQEPPPKNHPLVGAPHLLMTPHVAWASIEARQRLVREVTMNIDSFLKGKKRNRVD